MFITVPSASSDLFTESQEQSVRELWPIITLKVVTVAMDEKVARVGKGFNHIFLWFRENQMLTMASNQDEMQRAQKCDQQYDPQVCATFFPNRLTPLHKTESKCKSNYNLK